MHKIFLSFILIFAALMVGCSSQSPSDAISDAEASLASGDFKRARSVEHLISDSTSAQKLTPSELCRIALIYMHLAENNKAHFDEDVAVATECYLRAMNENADSVAAFSERMPVADLPAMHTLNELACAISSPVNLSDTTSEDYHLDHEH